MSDVNDENTYSSWLMCYFGTNNEDEFVSTAVKLDYHMLTKKMDHITAVAMWQESNISKKSQRIVLRYLSNFVGARLVLLEYCIYEFGNNLIVNKYVFGQNLFPKF